MIVCSIFHRPGQGFESYHCVASCKRHSRQEASCQFYPECVRFYRFSADEANFIASLFMITIGSPEQSSYEVERVLVGLPVWVVRITLIIVF